MAPRLWKTCFCSNTCPSRRTTACASISTRGFLCCHHPELGGSVSDIARALRLTDEAVEDAFRFWEREGLVKRLTDRPPTYALLPMRGAASVSEMDQQYYQFRDFNASLQRLFGDVILHGEVAIPQEWVTVFGYTVEAALKIVEYGLTVLRLSRRTPRATLRKLDNVAREWSERGARTLADVERMIAEKSGDMSMAEAVLKRFGLRRRPTEDELALARKWRGWGFDTEAVLAACGETTKASNPSFAYVDRVLEGRYLQTDANFAALRDVQRELGASALPTPETLKRYAAFLEAGFEAATVTAAAIALNAQNRHRFEDLERLLTQWAEKGLRRRRRGLPERSAAWKGELTELLRLAGPDRTPGLAEIALFDMEEPLLSGNAAFGGGEARGEGGAAMTAIDKLLAAWERGRSTPEQARARQERPRESAALTTPPCATSGRLRATAICLPTFFKVWRERRMTRAERVRALLDEYARQRYQNEREQRARAGGVFPATRSWKPCARAASGWRRGPCARPWTSRTRKSGAPLPDRCAKGRAHQRRDAPPPAGAGVMEDYLEEHYQVVVCRDTGYVGDAPARFCACFERRLAAMETEGAVQRRHSKRSTPPSCPRETASASGCCGAQRGFGEVCRPLPGCALAQHRAFRRGRLGKSFLLNCVYERVSSRGYAATRVDGLPHVR